ncbi:hypothetical protein DPEC_G00082950 [Dallia pectoralis]|uniref:Uncharacterized protein n=1 Tax=Dallia pectoralis TaxID=75939 RepID=A0ACC2GZ79_DALPE|nr:hypothetical protein DPEC_G00082950 [Dallia pectoralis]
MSRNVLPFWPVLLLLGCAALPMLVVRGSEWTTSTRALLFALTEAYRGEREGVEGTASSLFLLFSLTPALLLLFPCCSRFFSAVPQCFTELSARDWRTGPSVRAGPRLW